MCAVQTASHLFICQTEDKFFLLEKTNLNSWKLVKSVSSPAKPLDKEVINKKLSKNRSERSELLLNDVEVAILKCAICLAGEVQRLSINP